MCCLYLFLVFWFWIIIQPSFFFSITAHPWITLSDRSGVNKINSIRSSQCKVKNRRIILKASMISQKLLQKQKAKEKEKKKKLVPLIILLLKTNRYFCSPQQLGRQPYSKAIPILREIFTSHVFVLCDRKSKCNSTKFKTGKYLIITRSITQTEHYWINVNFQRNQRWSQLIFLYIPMHVVFLCEISHRFRYL